MDPATVNVGAVVQVNEAYKGWSPPPWLRDTTSDLLAAVDDRHLKGLHAVVLTNRDALPRDRKRFKVRWRWRRISIVDSLGMYHRPTPREGAWIELMADAVLAEAPKWAWRLSVVRDGLIGHTLYHEVGHHIHAVHAPEHREPENVADDWCNRLMRVMYRRRHPWFSRLMAMVVIPVRTVRRLLT